MKKHLLISLLTLIVVPILSSCEPIVEPTSSDSTNTSTTDVSSDPSDSSSPTSSSDSSSLTDSSDSNEPTSSETQSDTTSSSDSSTTSPTTEDTLIEINSKFDFDEPKDIYYEIMRDYKLISHIEGHGIADGDYIINNHFLIILKDFLIHLNPGNYHFDVHFTNRIEPINIEILNRNNMYRVINGSFETGNFFGWEGKTIFKGEKNLFCFREDGIVINNKYLESEVTYDGVGNYVYGIPTSSNQSKWEEKMGRLISSSFILGGSGHVSFMLGAAKNSDLVYVSFYDNQTNEEIARYGNYLYDFTKTNSDNIKLNLFQADLSDYLGKSLRVEIIDLGINSWDFMTFDHLETYLEVPLSEAHPAINIRPVFTQVYAPNQVANGRFEEGLEHWSISTQLGWQRSSGSMNTWRVSNGILKSDDGGDAARGLIRSSLFRVDGSGFAALRIGAAKGERFDKTTFVSVKEKGSNREVLRFANKNHDGTNMVKYFFDLSSYMNKELYFEIVDNAGSSWDTIFISSITTYYASRPSFSAHELASNLNY